MLWRMNWKYLLCYYTLPPTKDTLAYDEQSVFVVVCSLHFLKRTTTFKNFRIISHYTKIDSFLIVFKHYFSNAIRRIIITTKHNVCSCKYLKLACLYYPCLCEEKHFSTLICFLNGNKVFFCSWSKMIYPA